MTLDKLPTGKTATIKEVGLDGALRRHFLNMGITPSTDITLVKLAPMGDPMQFNLRGYELTLRKEDAKQIIITNIRNETVCPDKRSNVPRQDIAHPMAGENYQQYHTISKGEHINEGEPITFALAGNQNCGKTTLFNQLTGSNQHVGNFPGVTVDRKDGQIRGHSEATVVDLPGIYSLSPYTNEEIVTRDFLINSRPKGIINIVDATNIERNLYLTLQLIELDIPMVLALNMMDEVRENGGTVLINELESILGIPVVPISASKNEGVEELIEHAMQVARFRERPGRKDFCSSEGTTEQTAVHRCIHAIVHLIEDHAKRAKIPARFAASKLLEGDSLILEALKLDENEKELLDHIILQLENESKTDREAALADMRFRFISDVCSKTVVKPHESKEHSRSLKIDKILTGKFTAIPSFIAIMALIFWLTFGVFGEILSNLMEKGVDALTALVDKALTVYEINPVVHSLVIDGVFAGVGSVLSFLPIIVVLFFFLSILEDSGYMARISFVMDKPLRKLGLSGRSFVPMLIGFGCSVPAIMSTRTLSSRRDRIITIMLTPFMSCSAKLPIYALLTSAFFPNHQVLAMIVIYITGIIAGILFALVLKHLGKFKGKPVPFVMELPNYRLPGAKNVLQLIWDKAKDFITKAFTIIFVASIIIWFLQSFDLKLNVVEDSSQSLLAIIGGAVAPIFKPLGLNDWRISTALITGFTAKESVVSTLTVLMSGADITSIFTTLSACAFLVFCLLYTPCVAAIATVKRELGTKWSITVVITQCVVAWICAFAVYTLGGILI